MSFIKKRDTKTIPIVMSIDNSDKKAKAKSIKDKYNINLQKENNNKKAVSDNRQNTETNNQGENVNLQNEAANKKNVSNDIQNVETRKQGVSVEIQNEAANKKNVSNNIQNVETSKQGENVNTQNPNANKKAGSNNIKNTNTNKHNSNDNIQNPASENISKVFDFAKKKDSFFSNIYQRFNKVSSEARDFRLEEEEEKELDFIATAYDLSYESCGKYPNDPAYGITFSGKKAIKGKTIAVDPQVIPLGSNVYIELPKLYSYLNGWYIAEDTGIKVKGNIIDIFFGKAAFSEMEKFGSRKIKIKIFSPTYIIP